MLFALYFAMLRTAITKLAAAIVIVAVIIITTFSAIGVAPCPWGWRSGRGRPRSVSQAPVDWNPTGAGVLAERGLPRSGRETG